MSDDEDDSVSFTMDVETSHDIPGEMADVLEVKTEDCRECGHEMRATYDHEPGEHYCPECGVYKTQGAAATTVFGP